MWIWRARTNAIVSGCLLAALIIGSGRAEEVAPAGISAPAAAPAAASDAAPATNEWQHVGRTLSGTRYAPFTQISTTNVNGLKEAWIYRTGVIMSEVVPLQIGATLYMCSRDNVILAVDAEHGTERWRYDPKLKAGAIGHACRGVSYHRDASIEGECSAAIYENTRDARLIAVDAATGKPCSGFGKDGIVDLEEGMGPDPLGFLYATSPPVIVGDVIVINNCVYDGQGTDEPSGVIRAFNAKTGALVWAWDMGRPGVNTLPPPGETYTRGTPNSWGLMSADPALGLVYVPLGNPTPDYFGGYRSPEKEKFGSSLVALDVKDGSVRWSFQTTHHDLWDYDLGSQPVLVDFPTDHGPVPAVIQPTKRGEMFVLDRRTGEPLTDVEERPAPKGHTPGDFTAPTQPFSVGMPSVAGAVLREADMWGLTPIDQLWCRIKFRQARYEGPMTPIGPDGYNVRYPGYNGGSDGGSVSIDEEAGIMIAPNLHMPNYDRLIPRESPDAQKYLKRGPEGRPVINPGLGGPQVGTPYVDENPAWFSPLVVPCNAPPYAKLTAIDLKTRKVLWDVPLGTARNSGPFGIPSHLSLTMGVPENGGALVTKGGLVFFAGSQDGYIRAYETKTGKEIWRVSLPLPSEATPMTYLSPESNKQFIVVTAGGAIGTKLTGDYVVAYALSEAPKP